MRGLRRGTAGRMELQRSGCRMTHRWSGPRYRIEECRLTLPANDMGIEYIIHYVPPEPSQWTAFVAHLDNPVSNGWPAFVIELRDGSVYFCDNGRSEAAAVALRRIIDEALKHVRSVAVEE